MSDFPTISTENESCIESLFENIPLFEDVPFSTSTPCSKKINKVDIDVDLKISRQHILDENLSDFSSDDLFINNLNDLDEYERDYYTKEGEKKQFASEDENGDYCNADIKLNANSNTPSHCNISDNDCNLVHDDKDFHLRKRQSGVTCDISLKQVKYMHEASTSKKMCAISPIPNKELSSNVSECRNHNAILCNSSRLGNSTVVGCSKKNSLSSRIKQKLKQNAAYNLVAQTSVSKIRETTLQNALEEVQKIQERFTTTDIGPFYGLPSKVQLLFKSQRGIDKLYEWQHECLCLPAIKQKQNLIYSLPTSGGKTLVAEILIIRELLCHLKDAILVLPYVSLVQEKVRGLATFAVDLDFVIEECAGSKGSIPPRKRRRRHTLYVCTIEKAHSLVNSLIEAERVHEIGLMVADEIHMIGETGGRGAVLESLLAKVLYMSKKTQIIGMSATLSNMEDLQAFLHAEVYQKNFRPVELREYVKVSNKLFELKSEKGEHPVFVRDLTFDYTTEMLRKDPDMIMGLVMEVVPQNSCLIFCPTKKHCENVANMLYQLLPKSLKEHKIDDKRALYKAFCSEGNGTVCPILAKTLQFGVAYHHSGLTMDERKLIEEAYFSGTLCCLTCTSTLAAGVNLPAKRVILRAPYIARDFITFSRYKQMVGRAGRAGIDSAGESILIIQPGEEPKIQHLFSSNMDSCNSCLLTEPERLQMLVLSLIGLRIASTIPEIYEFMNHTLASVQCRQVGETPTTIFHDTIKVLTDSDLVVHDSQDKNKLLVTKLGKATFKGGLDVSRVQETSDLLREGLSGLALHSYLHLLFIVTPAIFSQPVPMNNDIYFQRYMSLSSADLTVAEHIGVTESLIVILASGRTIKSDRKPLLHHFYLTLILYDLWQQNSIWSVAQKYKLHRGVVQNLLNSAAGYGATLAHFCQELEEFWAYQQLLPSFVKQLSYCVTMELISLMELPAVKKGRARQFYVAGFKTLSDIVKADPKDLVSKIDHLPRKVATQIVSAAKMMLLEKAEALQEEAELLVEDFNNSVIIDPFNE